MYALWLRARSACACAALKPVVLGLERRLADKMFFAQTSETLQIGVGKFQLGRGRRQRQRRIGTEAGGGVAPH
ncbi:hypothetical protein [Candidatus Accumulibacter aalborgensis]|uniref:hypothetical protein n=1 Tax=Candidatus Accumulibacter aalborgensis TaxID=1860102 RepID=UPI001644A02A|nr:hypothetical protein [Candidatus Accumulibacter aalborgensis]